jgi:hypothetical protein
VTVKGTLDFLAGKTPGRSGRQTPLQLHADPNTDPAATGASACRIESVTGNVHRAKTAKAEDRQKLLDGFQAHWL